jgi:hypothetical protein
VAGGVIGVGLGGDLFAVAVAVVVGVDIEGIGPEEDFLGTGPICRAEVLRQSTPSVRANSATR